MMLGGVEKTRDLRYGRRGALTALGLLVLGVVMLDHQGLLKPLDDLAYDTCYPWQNRWHDLPARVLLVDATEQSTIWSDPRELERLVERLEGLGAKRIGLALEGSLSHVPENLSESVVWGRRVIHDEDDPTQWRLIEAAPKEWPGRWGCLGAAVSSRGMCRAHRLTYSIDARDHASFEAVLAEGLQEEPGDVSRFWEADGPGRIRFRGGVGSLPHVPAALVLEDRIVPQLVAGRVVLVGGSSEPLLRELHTPMAASMPGMRLLEIQGHAVNTLLTNSTIHALSGVWRALLTVMVAVAAFVIYTRCTTRIGFLVTAVALGLLVATAVACLAWFGTWLPVVQTGFVLVGTFAIVFARKVEYSRTALNHLLFDLSTRIWRRSWTTSFFSREDPWPEVISFIRQTLDLHRLIILELPSTHHHVSEVSAFNCSLADIQEMRRDIRRWPYTDAIAGDGPYRIDVVKRPYLRPLETTGSGGVETEDQCLVPLRFAGELFGFLAVGVLVERIPNRNHFEQRLTDIADQTAELLYRRRYALQQQHHRENPLARLGRLPEETAVAELSQATWLLERRLSRFEQILRESSVSVAIYDLFGQLMVANVRMRDLLHREGANVDNMTTVDLLRRLTGREIDEVRELLGHVIVQKQCQSLAVELGEQRGSHMLHVRPLEWTAASSDHPDEEGDTFEVQGILCELVDRSAAVELHQLKDNLTETLGHSLRNDLGAIELATTLIVDERVTTEARKHYELIVHGKISEASDLLRKARGLLLCSEDDELTDCVPVDFQTLLERAILGVSDEIEKRRLSVNVVRPELTSHVFAVPRELKRILEAILSVLIQDARDGTAIEIGVSERMTEVVFQFINEGFGVATENLRKALEAPENPDATDVAENFAPLSGAAELLNQWGGKLVASGAVGKGMELALSLRRFS